MAMARPRLNVPKKITLQKVKVTLRGRFGAERRDIVKIIEDRLQIVTRIGKVVPKSAFSKKWDADYSDLHD